jgi:hypothetical protein
MSDTHDLLILPQSSNSLLIRSDAHSSLIARGRQAATALLSSRNEPLCLAAAMLNGAWGFINQAGKFIVPPAYVWVGCFSENKACCSTSADGDARPVLISWRFDHGMTAADGERFLFRYGQQPGVLPSNSLGYMNMAGETLVPPQFVCAEPFKDGVARVAVKEMSGTGFIDVGGRAIGGLEFDEAANFCEGFAIVQVAGRFGAITLQGEYAVPPKYDYVWDFSGGLARVLVGEKVGFVNGNGELVIDPVFDAADGFSENMAAVCIERDWGYIDNTGAFVIEPQLWSAGRFRNGKSQVESWDSERPYWIDAAGSAVPATETESDDDLQLKEGLSRVQVGDFWGFQDASGVFVVEPKFRDAGDFSNRLARVKSREGVWGYIDQCGIVKIPCRFDNARDFVLAKASNADDC